MGIDDHDTFTGLTQLHEAAASANLDKVIELLDAGADANIQANGEVRAELFANGGLDIRSSPGSLVPSLAPSAPAIAGSHGTRLPRSSIEGPSRDRHVQLVASRRAPTRRFACSFCRRALFPDTNPSRSFLAPRPARDRNATAADLFSLYHSIYPSHLTELRQDRRDDRRVERLHRDP
jgi:hypothetical protein